MATGYVYVLSNPSMPGVVKIGRSAKGGEVRSKAIFQTGVPQPFALEFEIYCDDCQWLELEVHKSFAGERVCDKREFFKVDPPSAIATIVGLYMSMFTDDRVVGGLEHDAVMDLNGLAVRTDFSLHDLATSVGFVSEFAWKAAITERDAFFAKAFAQVGAAE
jgi:hypothetical protein